MGFWTRLRELLTPQNEEDDGMQLVYELQELEKRADERRMQEKMEKVINKLRECGMNEEELSAYDPARAVAVPSGRIKALIVSDTHGCLKNLKKAIDIEKPIDILIHCGDIVEDEDAIRRMANCHCRMVAGNMDFMSPCPPRDIIKLGKHSFYLCHGHREGVNGGTQSLAMLAQAMGVEVAFYGHTHIPDISEDQGVILVNPGSIAKPRQLDGRFTYVVMELDTESSERPVFTLKNVPDGVAEYRH